MIDLAATIFEGLKTKRALDEADRRPCGVHFGGIAYDRPIDTRSDAELRAEAEERAQAVHDYQASPQGQAERARRAALEAKRVAVQRAFGLPE